MRKKDETGSIIEMCPIRNVIARFGNKWALLTVLIIGEQEVVRFNELSRLIPDVSSRVLSSTLRTLEADGFVSRKVYAVVPPKVEYRLTDVGESLLPLIRQLTEWAQTNMEKGNAPPPAIRVSTTRLGQPLTYGTIEAAALGVEEPTPLAKIARQVDSMNDRHTQIVIRRCTVGMNYAHAGVIERLVISMYAAGQVYVLGVHEEALVEETGLSQCRSPYKHKATLMIGYIMRHPKIKML